MSNVSEIAFQKWYPFMSKHEGGWADHSWDPGGKTNRGITIGTWQRNAWPWIGVPGTEATLRMLTQPQHYAFSKKYFDVTDVMPDDQRLKFLHAENVWGGNGVATLQYALNMLGANLTVDNGFGPLTKAALDEQTKTTKGINDLVTAMLPARAVLLVGDTTARHAINGWRNRVNEQAKFVGENFVWENDANDRNTVIDRYVKKKEHPLIAEGTDPKPKPKTKVSKKSQ